MKRVVLFWLVLLDVLSAFGQATVRFSNLEPLNGINAPFYDADGTNRLAGDNYRAALFWAPAGASEDQMLQAGTPQPFRTGNFAGYWNPATLAIPGPGMQSIVVQVRFWDTQGGTLLSFEQAYAARGKVGFSSVLQLTPPISGTVYLNGLRSVALIPVVAPLSFGETRTTFDAMAIPNGLQLASLCNEPAGRLRWFHLNFTSAGDAVIRVESSLINPVIAVFTSCLQSSDTCAPVACSNDRAPGQTVSEVRFNARTNMTYAVAVGGQNGATGAFHVSFSMPATLAVQALPNGRVEISWPASAHEFALEATTNTSPPLLWEPVSATPIGNGDRNLIQLDSTGACVLYRLKRNVPP